MEHTTQRRFGRARDLARALGPGIQVADVRELIEAGVVTYLPGSTQLIDIDEAIRRILVAERAPDSGATVGAAVALAAPASALADARATLAEQRAVVERLRAEQASAAASQDEVGRRLRAARAAVADAHLRGAGSSDAADAAERSEADARRLDRRRESIAQALVQAEAREAAADRRASADLATSLRVARANSQAEIARALPALVALLEHDRWIQTAMRAHGIEPDERPFKKLGISIERVARTAGLTAFGWSISTGDVRRSGPELEDRAAARAWFEDLLAQARSASATDAAPETEQGESSEANAEEGAA